MKKEQGIVESGPEAGKDSIAVTFTPAALYSFFVCLFVFVFDSLGLSSLLSSYIAFI